MPIGSTFASLRPVPARFPGLLARFAKCSRVLLLSAAYIGVATCLCSLAGCNESAPATSGNASSGAKSPASFAFVVNGVADFWIPAQAGARVAAQELGVDLSIVTPSNMTDQTRKLEDLLVRGIDGVAVSPINSDNQIDILNRVAKESILVIHDSDAPQTERKVYIGTDNYEAGYLCGGLARQALGEGGKAMIFIGRMDQDNSKYRRQGCIDAILGRPKDASRPSDPPGEEVTSDDGKYVVLGTLTDQFDRPKAKANAEDTLTRYPDVKAMVGLFEYNPPLIMEALDRAGKLGKVAVIGFDENQVMLQGIKDGSVVGTVVQNPFQYGYQSIRILHELSNGDESSIPDDKFIDIPSRVIDASNVDEFWADLKEKISSGK